MVSWVARARVTPITKSVGLSKRGITLLSLLIHLFVNKFVLNLLTLRFSSKLIEKLHTVGSVIFRFNVQYRVIDQ